MIKRLCLSVYFNDRSEAIIAEETQKTTENFIVTGGMDDIIKIWEIKNGKLIVKQQLEGHSLGVISVAISPDGKSKNLLSC